MTNEEAIKALKRIRDEAIDNFVGDWQDYEAFDIALKALADCKTEPNSSEKLQTDIARAIVHKAIDDTPIAEDAYPDLRQKMHDAVDNYEPQSVIVQCYLRESCDHYGDKQVCGRCREYNLYSHTKTEPQTEDEILREQCRAFIDIVEQTDCGWKKGEDDEN